LDRYGTHCAGNALIFRIAKTLNMSHRRRRHGLKKTEKDTPPVRSASPLPNPRVAETDEYLTNSHIFYKAIYPALNTRKIREN
jgi:hypothetical protein